MKTRHYIQGWLCRDRGIRRHSFLRFFPAKPHLDLSGRWGMIDGAVWLRDNFTKEHDVIFDLPEPGEAVLIWLER